MRRIARPNRLLPALAAMLLLGACQDDKPSLFPADGAGDCANGPTPIEAAD